MSSTSSTPAPYMRLDPRLGAALVCLLVVIARITLALTTNAPPLGPDAQGYDGAARRLASDGYYAWVYASDDVADPAANAMHMPGYTVALAAVYAVAGTDVSAQPLVSLVQAVLSGLLLWGLFMLGSALARPAVGLTTVLLGAAYVPFWYSYREVLTEDVFALLCVWPAVALVTAVRRVGAPRNGLYVVAGLLVAAATYVRPTALVWLLLAGVTLLAFDASRRRVYAQGGAVIALCLVVALAPWWYRNARIYEAFVPFNTMTAAGSLVAAFESGAEYERVSPALYDGHLAPDEELAHNERIARVAREQRQRWWARDPFGFLRTRARLTAISLLTYHPNPWGSFEGWGGVAEAIHLAILSLAAWGAWARRRDPAVWLLLSMPAALLLLHVPTLIYSRYLFPMMPMLIALAALGVHTRSLRAEITDGRIT